jgi:hypothetical protein
VEILQRVVLMENYTELHRGDITQSYTEGKFQRDTQSKLH